MISRLKDENNNEGIAIIVDSDYLEYENNPYCPNCREIGKISRLKERLYMDENGKRYRHLLQMLMIGFNVGSVALSYQ